MNLIPQHRRTYPCPLSGQGIPNSISNQIRVSLPLKGVQGDDLKKHRSWTRPLNIEPHGCITEIHREGTGVHKDLRESWRLLHMTLGNSLTRHETSKRMGLLILGFIFWLMAGFPVLLSAQDYTQTIERTTRFDSAGDSDNELAVYNIHGSVTVEGYTGNEIQVKAIQQLRGTTREIRQAKDELEFVVEQEGNRVLIYINAPFIQLRKRKGQVSYNINRWNDDYDFLYDITVQVPRKAHVRASTINNGKVTIRNTRGEVHASNVNGELELSDISGPTNASTVNGDITVRYYQSPGEDSKFNTVNGTIEVNYPEDLSADIRFKSMHGDLYTDFEDIEYLQARVEQDKSKHRRGVTYHIDKYAPIRIGEGGPTFSFEVLNGNVYVKQIRS